MPFSVITIGEKQCPVAVCDHCGQRIDRAEDGNALWQMKKAKGKWQVEPAIFLTHKKCNMAFERGLGRSDTCTRMAEELDVFTARLVQNLNINLDTAKRTKRKMDFLDSIE